MEGFGQQWIQAINNTINALAIKGDTIFEGGSKNSGAYGEVFMSSNNGINWDLVNTGLTSSNHFVYALAISDEYFCRNNGRVYFYLQAMVVFGGPLLRVEV